MKMMRKSTNEKLHKAFLQLLEKKSIHEIEILELAELADIDRTTIYRHFSSEKGSAKTHNDIVVSCYNEIVEDMNSVIVNALQPDKMKDFELMYSQLCVCIEENAYVLRVLLGPTAPTKFRVSMYEFIKRRYTQNIQGLYGTYCRFARNMAELDRCATFFAYGLLGLLETWLFDGCRNRNQLLKSINTLDDTIDHIYQTSV